jgi:hypothetical protein
VTIRQPLDSIPLFTSVSGWIAASNIGFFWNLLLLA